MRQLHRVHGPEDGAARLNDQDPPDDYERNRNAMVQTFQGNRNPFIDHPEWARCVIDNMNCPVVVDVIFANGFQQ